MRVLLRDYLWSSSGGSDWQSALNTFFSSDKDAPFLAEGWVGDPSCDPGNLPKSDTGREVIVFVHQNDGARRSQWAKAAASSLDGHVVFLRRGGQVDHTVVGHALNGLSPEEKRRCGQRVHACWWGVAEFLQPKLRFELKMLRTAIQQNREDWWKWLQPTGTSVLAALAILCQGYLIARGHTTKSPGEKPDRAVKSPMSAGAAKTVRQIKAFWRPPFTGLDLERRVQEECHGHVPDGLGKLVGVLVDHKAKVIARDTVVIAAMQDLESQLK